MSYKELIFASLVITLILVSATEAKGGRGGGGGRSGGRSSGRSRGGGFFSSSSSSGGKKSGSGSTSYGGSNTGMHTSGGWFHGFFHSTPHLHTYRPIYVSSTSSNSYHVPRKEEDEATATKDAGNYAVGYSISRALGGDFFSIFNVVNDISKYPDKMRNKELTTTTTQSPVSTYNLNYIINTPFPISYRNTFEDMTTTEQSTYNDKNVREEVKEIEDIFSKLKDEMSPKMTDVFETTTDSIAQNNLWTYLQQKELYY